MIPVSMTYDGGDPSHRELVLPGLNKRGLHGTFYLEPTDALDGFAYWKKAVELGHEVGDGTLLGACLPDGSLPRWSQAMILEELRSSGELIDDLFRGAPYSVGLPLGKSVCDDSENYAPAVAQGIERAVRTGNNGWNSIEPDNLLLNFVPMVGLTGTQMIEVVRNAIKAQKWVILGFYGVGSGPRSVDLGAHEELLDFLIQNEDLVKVETVARVAEQARLKASFKVV